MKREGKKYFSLLFLRQKMKTKSDFKGEIINIENIAKDTCKMDILSSMEKASAGQFISIFCPNTTLRRPFSIANFENNTITILFKLKGEGTNYLKNLKKGDNINFLAPLGNGFAIENKKSLLVGAGIGIAPMIFLKNTLNKKNIENLLITGFKSNNEIIEGSDRTVVGGSVLDYLDEIIKNEKIEMIYSCGPLPVLKGITGLSKKYNISSQIAMEKVMACSIGVCRGCIIKLIKNNEVINASVCKDGPVFKGSEVIWD